MRTMEFQADDVNPPPIAYEEILGHLDTAVLFVDPSGAVSYRNDEAVAMFSMIDADVPKNFSDYFASEYRSDIERLLRAADGETRETEALLQSTDTPATLV